jgi:hypothetical protein
MALLMITVLSPKNSNATLRELHVELSYAESAAGFILYKDGVQVCERLDPNVTTMDCLDIEISPNPMTFVLTAVDADGIESPQSAPYILVPPPVYTVSITNGVGGRSYPATSMLAEQGTNPLITIVPNANYHITSIIDNGINVGVTASYVISAISMNHTISVAYALNTFTLTTSVSGVGGTISPVGVKTMNYGANQIITAAPAFGYRFTGFMENGALLSATSPYTVSQINKNRAIAATFAATTIPVYRFRSKTTGVYLYTSDPVEITAVNAMTASWINEGLKFYVYMTP